MAPKAKAKPKAKERPKSKGGKVADKKMQPKGGDSKKKQEVMRQYEQMTQEKSALLIQRIARGVRARRAYASLLALEDSVLSVPTRADQAQKLLNSEPPQRAAPPGQGEPSKTEGQSPAPDAEGHGHSMPPSPSRRKTPGTSSRRESSRRPLQEDDVAEEQVQRHLAAAVPNSRCTASRIFWLLSTWGLGLEHLHRIFKHHMLRRRNRNGQVRVRLVLMQHGDSSRLPVSPSAGSPEDEGELPGRTLIPEGWVQVTRTAWSLRLHPEFQPHVIFSSTVPCCQETAERVRKVIDDAIDDLEQTTGGDAPDPAAGQSEERAPEGVGAEYISPKRPKMIGCEELDLQPISTAIGPGMHRIVEAVTAAVGELPIPPAQNGILPPPFILMFVAGGVVLEALLACLCAEAKKPVRVRLGGGDIVMLESRPMMRVLYVEVPKEIEDEPANQGTGNGKDAAKSEGSASRPTSTRTLSRASTRMSSRPGSRRTVSKREVTSKPLFEQDDEPEIQEVIRPVQEVWHDALLRSKWKVARHVRGQDWSLSGKSSSAADTKPKLASTMRAEWRSYAGEPLIFSQKEFSQLCTRAGSTVLPLSSDMGSTLRPLVKNYRSRKAQQPQQGSSSARRSGAGPS